MSLAESDYLVSAKIIEFFWFLFALVLFVFAMLIKFYLKKDLHEEQVAGPARSIAYNQNLQPQEKKEPASSEEIIVMNGDDAIQKSHPAPVMQMNSGDQHKFESIFKSADNLASFYLPILTLAILNVNNWASHGFAVACVMIYLLSVILFNELEIQKGFSSEAIKSILYLQLAILRFSNHIWLFGLCINYFVVAQN